MNATTKAIAASVTAVVAALTITACSDTNTPDVEVTTGPNPVVKVTPPAVNGSDTTRFCRGTVATIETGMKDLPTSPFEKAAALINLGYSIYQDGMDLNLTADVDAAITTLAEAHVRGRNANTVTDISKALDTTTRGTNALRVACVTALSESA